MVVCGAERRGVAVLLLGKGCRVLTSRFLVCPPPYPLLKHVVAGIWNPTTLTTPSPPPPYPL